MNPGNVWWSLIIPVYRHPYVKGLARRVRLALWTLNGYVGRRVSMDADGKVTVLITYFNPARTKHIGSQVRNALKCDFVDRVVVSSHNPEVRVDELVRAADKRLVFRNQPTRRGCGYRWAIAAELNPEYLIVVDDDLLLFPSQLATLARSLVREPEAPHGFAGFVRMRGGEFEYHRREDADVDYICEVYAVTQRQLVRYGELRQRLIENGIASDTIDSSMDFMVISRAGSRQPEIHTTFHLLQCDTWLKAGVAVHKEAGFEDRMSVVDQSLTHFVQPQPS